MPETDIGKSFFHALNGIKTTLKTQQHLHLHIFTFFLLLYVIIFGEVKLEDALILAGISFMVIITEMINTSIEILCDFISEKHSEYIKIVKDISAGAVLLATIAALTIGYIVLDKPLILSINRFKFFIAQIPLYIFYFIIIAFGIFYLLYNYKIYKKIYIAFSSLSFSISLLVTWLVLESFTVITIFFIVIGGIILIEAILRKNKIDEVYLSGIWGIICGVTLYVTFSNHNFYLNNDYLISFMTGLSPIYGSSFTAVHKMSLNFILFSLIGEILILTFLLSWGSRFKHSFLITPCTKWINRKDFKYFILVLTASALPLPIPGVVLGALTSIAFEVNRKLSWLASVIGIIIKCILCYYSIPLYKRLGG